MKKSLVFTCLLLAALGASLPAPSARAQTLYVPSSKGNTVTAYNAATGAALPGFIPISVTDPLSTGVLGTTLYVSTGNNTISTFNATTGAALPGFTSPSGLSGPTGLVIGNNVLYVANETGNSIAAYNLATGAALPGFTPPTGLSNPYDVLFAVVPEPSTWAAVVGGAGLLGLALRRRASAPARA